MPLTDSTLRETPPSPRKTGQKRTEAIAITICIIIVGSVIILSIPAVVTVSGKVIIVGSEKRAELIAFTSGSGHEYVAGVSYGGYSIDLPNFSTYRVTLGYAVGPFSGQVADAGNFSLYSLSSRVTRNFAG